MGATGRCLIPGIDQYEGESIRARRRKRESATTFFYAFQKLKDVGIRFALRISSGSGSGSLRERKRLIPASNVAVTLSLVLKSMRCVFPETSLPPTFPIVLHFLLP